jgi:hypothetical protein
MPDRFLSAELLAALDRFIAEQRPDLSRADALKIIAADWLVGHGYMLPTDDHRPRPATLDEVVRDHRRAD